MEPQTVGINCGDYSVKTDVYEGSANGPVALFLIGRTSSRSKPRYHEFLARLAKEFGITSIIFDYTGHGDSPFTIEERSAEQHLQEALTVFDWMKTQYPNRKTLVSGTSYGGFLATHLSQHRKFDYLILQAPSIYRPEDFTKAYDEEDDDKTFAYRRNREELARHPLLQNAKSFTEKTLLMVHGRDDRIPKDVTDTYAKAFGCEAIIEDIPHSQGQATPQELEKYNQDVVDWIKSSLS